MLYKVLWETLSKLLDRRLSPISVFPPLSFFFFFPFASSRSFENFKCNGSLTPWWYSNTCYLRIILWEFHFHSIIPPHLKINWVIHDEAIKWYLKWWTNCEFLCNTKTLIQYYVNLLRIFFFYFLCISALLKTFSQMYA